MLTKEHRTAKIVDGFKVAKKVLFILLSIFYSLNSSAQCAMCRAALESEGDVAKGEAINSGIVYLMAIPYILVGALGLVVYKMYAKKKRNQP